MEDTPSKQKQKLFLTMRVCSILAVLENSVLPMGLRQLTRNTKSDVSYLQSSLSRLNEKLRMKFGFDHHTALVVNDAKKYM